MRVKTVYVKEKEQTMKIYAEWENNGVFDNGLFNSWDEYYAAFFNPDIELLCVRVIN